MILLTAAEQDELSKALAELSILTASAIMHALDHAERCEHGGELVALLAQHSRDVEPVLMRLMPFVHDRSDVARDDAMRFEAGSNIDDVGPLD